MSGGALLLVAMTAFGCSFDTSGGGGDGDGGDNGEEGCEGVLAFDTQQRVDVQDTMFEYLNEFSIGAWMRPQGLSGGNRHFAISRHTSSAPAGGYRLAFDEKEPEVVVYSGVGGEFCHCQFLTSIPDDVWTHVAASFTGNTLRLFLDGEIARECPCSFSRIGAHVGPLAIGNRSLFADRGFQGQMDDVFATGTGLAEAFDPSQPFDCPGAESLALEFEDSGQGVPDLCATPDIFLGTSGIIETEDPDRLEVDCFK